MIPVLILNGNLEQSASGKAYKVVFKNKRNGQPMLAWVALSKSKIEKGMLWVEEWMMKPHMEGIGSLSKAGHECVSGKVIPAEVAPIEVPQTSYNTYQELGDACPIKKGFFTVVRDEDGQRYTFRFKTNKKGQVVVGLLVGSNNVTDYAWFAFAGADGKLRRWKKAYLGYESTYINVPNETLQECYQAILGNTEAAGLRYAKEYNNCSRCGRILTVPESIDLGLGPECAGLKYGGK